MTHISKESGFKVIRLFSLDTCLNQFLFNVLHIGYIPRDANDKRFTTIHRYKCFHRLYNTCFPTSGNVRFLHIHPFFSTYYLKVVSMKPIGIFPIGEYFNVCMPDSFGCRYTGMGCKGFIPVEVTEFICRIFNKKVDRYVIQDTLQQVILLAKLVTEMDNVSNVLCKKPHNFFLSLTVKESRDLTNTILTRLTIISTVGVVSPMVTDSFQHCRP